MSWRVAHSLDVLLDELNAAAPARSKISDGSIGDAAHASRSSDHNPWVSVAAVGVVRARDFTHDPAGGLDCNDLAAALVPLLGRHPALGPGAYVIWNRRIISADRLDEGWRWYGDWLTGRNPHDHHLHVSVATSASGFDTTAPWGINQKDDDMPNYTDWDQNDRDALARDVAKAVSAELAGFKKNVKTRLGRAVTKLNDLKKRSTVSPEDLEPIRQDLDDLSKEA